MFTALYTFISALTFRVRGGLRIPFTDKKFPLCKWWFATWIALLAYLLKGFNISTIITAFIAGKMCTSFSGWGTYIGALLKGGPISETDKDDLNITDTVQNRIFPWLGKAKEWCLKHKYFNWLGKILPDSCYKNNPKLYGFITLSLRGGLTTFILGLAFNEPLFMLIGLLQGSVYWLGGWTCRHIYNDGKYGWKISEWYWGGALGLFLTLLALYVNI